MLRKSIEIVVYLLCSQVCVVALAQEYPVLPPKPVEQNPGLAPLPAIHLHQFNTSVAGYELPVVGEGANDCEIACAAGQSCEDDCRIAKRYAPIIWFSANERFFPSDVEHVLSNAALHMRGIGKGCKRNVPNGMISLPRQYQALENGMFGHCQSTDRNLPSDRKPHRNGDYFLKLNEETEATIGRGLDPREVGHSGIPIYAKVFRRRHSNGALSAIEVQYYVNYPKDDQHQGDWELFAVLLSPTGRPMAAKAYGHGKVMCEYSITTGLSGPQCPANVTDLQFSDSEGNVVNGLSQWNNHFSHPVVYSSEGKHAFFVHAGKHRCPIFWCIDKTRQGIEWRSHSKVVVLPRASSAEGEFDWLAFAGKWGPRFKDEIGFGRGWFGNSPRGPIGKPEFCSGVWKQSEVGDFPDHCSPLCRSGESWVKIYRNSGARDPAVSEVDWEAFNTRDNFEFENFANMDFGDNASMLRVCSEYRYLLFEHKNFGGRAEAINAQRLVGDVELTDRALEDEVSSSAFDRCMSLAESWVAFFKDNSFRSRSYAISPVIFPGWVSDFSKTEVGRGVSSVRWCLPPTYTYRVYDRPFLEAGRPDPAADFFDLEGTGRIEESDLRYDFLEFGKGGRHPMQDSFESGWLLQDQLIASPNGLNTARRRASDWAVITGVRVVSKRPNQPTVAVAHNFSLKQFDSRIHLRPRIEAAISDGDMNWQIDLQLQRHFPSNPNNYYIGIGPLLAKSNDADGHKLTFVASAGAEYELGPRLRPFFVELSVAGDQNIYSFQLSIGLRFWN